MIIIQIKILLVLLIKKSEQWKASISATIRWDIINPQRNPQIEASKKTFEKAKNSFLIVSRDLELKSKNRFHKPKESTRKFNYF